jgi:thiamine kinase-like enzyme
MAFLLSTKNVFSYSIEQKICKPEDRILSEPELKPAKNFNVLLSLQNGCSILIKQERLNRERKTAGEFLNEWRVHEGLRQSPELDALQPLLSEVVHFDADNSIIVFHYLTDHRDLTHFYAKENVFPIEIPSTIGKVLATIHQATFDRQDYRDFLVQDRDSSPSKKATKNLDRLEPEIFGAVPADGLKFFALYQRFDSLGQAIAQLTEALQPCCLTHNDLKLNNILLHNDWEQTEGSPIRLIDWERGAWGDPVFDLGTLVASYLQMWLGSLVVSKDIAIEESLRLAMTTLEQIQPSIAALISAYFETFPKIVEHRPDFLERVVQCTGLALIQQIQATIQYQKSFGNMGICMLQVAKSLLCRTDHSIPTVFGMSASELLERHLSPV